MAGERLSKGQKEKIKKWLSDRWAGEVACSVCGHQGWSIADHLVAPVTLIGKGMSLGGETYPQTMVICNNCGHTLYFNVVRMQLDEE